MQAFGRISSRGKGWGHTPGVFEHAITITGSKRRPAARLGNLIASSHPRRSYPGRHRDTNLIWVPTSLYRPFDSRRTGSLVFSLPVEAYADVSRSEDVKDSQSQVYDFAFSFGAWPIDRRPEHLGTPLWTMSGGCGLWSSRPAQGRRISMETTSLTATRKECVRISCRLRNKGDQCHDDDDDHGTTTAGPSASVWKQHHREIGVPRVFHASTPSQAIDLSSCTKP